MKKHIFLIFLLTLVFQNLCGQEQTQPDSTTIRLKHFVRNIEQFRMLYPQEKVYLHFDNTGYYLGETIWFKAYVVNASDNTPKVMSKVLYVELLNSRGILLGTKKLEIVNGQCHGDFYLTTFNYDYHPGYYEIRAYTKNMLNFGDETVFSRVFPVFNEPKNTGEYTATDLKEGHDVNRLNLPRERKKFKKQKQVNIDFYPEGGNLTGGLINKVAFRITDENGMGTEATGTIVNTKNEIVTEFRSQHEGMGIFDYTPDGSKYKVEIHQNNRNYKFDLPQSLPSGYIMQVNSLLQKDLLLLVDKTPGYPIEPLGITIMCRGKLSYFMTLQSKDYPWTHRIPKTELAAGVNQITLFNAKGEIYAERLVFIFPSNREQYSLKAKADKKSYTWRQKINLDFSGEPRTTFSLAVRDASTTPQTSDAGNIFTNLLLSSDLKGYIENPSYYFASADIEHQRALDLLMMVQGWRRYQWQQMAGIQPFKPTYEPEKKLMINGHLEGKANDIRDIKEVNMEIALDKNYLTATSKIDSTGNFSLSIDTVLHGTHYMFLAAEGLKKADRSIRLDRWFSPAPKTYPIYETSNIPNKEAEDSSFVRKRDTTEQVTEADSKAEKDSIGGYHELKEISVAGKKKGKDLIYNVERDRDKAVDLGLDYPENAFYYLVEKNNGFLFKSSLESKPDNVAATSGFQIWGNYAFNLRYMINDKKWKEYLEDNRYPTWHGNKIFIVDLEQINRIVIHEWEKKQLYSIVRRKTISCIYGYLFPYDNTVYYLMRRTPAYRVTSFEGYSTAKDFYVGRPERENYIPAKTDHSRTLYWNPDVKTDKDGKAKVNFYNNAWCRLIEISAEGVSKKGTPIVNK